MELRATASEDAPKFLPDGRLTYRAAEGGKNYLNTQKADGTEKRRVSEEPILDLQSVSPDGRWATVTQKDNQNPETPYRTVAYPIAGGEPIVICATICVGRWSEDEKYMELTLLEVSQDLHLAGTEGDGFSGNPNRGIHPRARTEGTGEGDHDRGEVGFGFSRGVQGLGLMRLCHCSGQAGWERCIARATPS